MYLMCNTDLIMRAQKQVGFIYSHYKILHQDILDSDQLYFVNDHLKKLTWTIDFMLIAFEFYHLLSISGGKDSLVLLHIAKHTGREYRAYMFHNDREDDEVLQLTWNIDQNVRLCCPWPGFEDLVKKYGEPKPWRRWCTSALKVRPSKAVGGDVIITGSRAAESRRRNKRGYLTLHKGQIYYHPLFFWTDRDIWFYSGWNQLTMWRGYLMGERRMGCAPCPFAPTRQRLDPKS